MKIDYARILRMMRPYEATQTLPSVGCRLSAVGVVVDVNVYASVAGNVSRGVKNPPNLI